MNFSVLINNFNYGRYLGECVESVLRQSHPAYEIIVVDDGSQDDSLQILQDHYGENPRIKIVAQINQGQTAAIAEGINRATGDVACLLDADDRYKPDYLSRLEQHYAAHPEVDFTFCRYDPFGPGKSTESIWLHPQRDYDYGYTALLAYFGTVDWIGNLTSTLSMRLRLARALNLHEIARDLYVKGQADYAVLLAASLAGGRKYYLHQTLTEYRLHEKNLFQVRRSTEAGRYIAWFNDQSRSNYLKKRANISDEMYSCLPAEVRTVLDPLPAHLEIYQEILKTRQRQSISPLRRWDRSFRKWRKGLFKTNPIPSE